MPSADGESRILASRGSTCLGAAIDPGLGSMWLWDGLDL